MQEVAAAVEEHRKSHSSSVRHKHRSKAGAHTPPRNGGGGTHTQQPESSLPGAVPDTEEPMDTSAN